MDSLISQFGYLGLVAMSFLSATLFPLTAEVAVVGMIAVGYNPILVGISAVAGSFLGSVLNYTVGKKGTDIVLSRYIKYEPRWLQRAEEFFKRWGVMALFFSWLPFIGDPLTFVAGVVHTEFRVFLAWVLSGKIIRMAVLILLALEIIPGDWFLP